MPRQKRSPKPPSATRGKGRPVKDYQKFLLRQEKNLRIFIPRVDWTTIRTGQKTEFRNYGRRLGFEAIQERIPRPVVGYAPRLHDAEYGNSDTCLLTLEDIWVEPLGAISPESLEAEGFATLSDFRRYFDERYPAGYRPLANVTVYRVHPMTDDEQVQFMNGLWDKLYGQFG